VQFFPRGPAPTKSSYPTCGKGFAEVCGSFDFSSLRTGTHSNPSRFFSKLKRLRRVAIRYDTLASTSSPWSSWHQDGEFTQYSRSQIGTTAQKAWPVGAKKARTDRSPVGFLAEKDLRVAAIFFELRPRKFSIHTGLVISVIFRSQWVSGFVLFVTRETS
jgi:hypothetical protein